jgi:hypothetical protein
MHASTSRQTIVAACRPPDQSPVPLEIPVVQQRRIAGCGSNQINSARIKPGLLPMFIWRGRGFLVPPIAFLCSLGAELIAKSLGGEGYWETHSYPLSMALLVAAGLIWGADLYLFRNPGRILRDEQTGDRFLFVPKHDLFFLRMRWWSLVCVGFAIAIFVANWTPGFK